MAGCLLCLLGIAAHARVVTVEDGSGAGFLVRQGGNCYVMLPTHLHGRSMEGIRLGSDRAGGPIGTAKIVYVAPDDADISLGIVRGGLERDCGEEWRRLPRDLSDRLTPGAELMLQRPRQQVFEGRRLILHSSGPELVRLVPAPGERADLFGGTSGAVAFQGSTPIAMVLQANGRSEAIAMRMDKVTGLVGQMLQNPVSRAAPALGAAPATAEPGAADLEADSPATLPPGDPLEAVEWSAHPVDGAVDPGEMLRGAGPWIFELGPKPVSLTLRLTDTDRLSRIRLRAATGTAAAIPRGISIVTNSATDPARPRLSSIPAPDMSPDGEFDLRIGERFAHTVTVTILSSWGGASPVRLDAVSID
ncbi:hypothetical protein FIU97_10955 [Roseivivax sp. THAF40]|uniref:hypothetical protein n=1 Tax=unclassified Roseivivax TaxID=2639302 RepID=UPI0012681462|nr:MULTISPECIES: hypothetical protein [unclassified Roseivivax]QFS83348.1 hypothetical protein FIV09_10970 [Roseivivax sp. THAF197b]QFT47092.1 hypothetical protein FIU97_10955 [Roseivivax sp. THAF40]